MSYRSIIAAISRGLDIHVQHYTVSQTGQGPATATITLDNPVPVGESFAHIHTRNHHGRGKTDYAIARLQTIVDDHYTQCLVLSDDEPGYQNTYQVQVVTSKDFSVQTVNYDSRAGDTAPWNDTITAVDRNHTFVVSSFTGGEQPRRSIIRANLTSDTNLQTRPGQSFSGESIWGCHYIVSSPKINVQHGTVTLSGTSTDVSVTDGEDSTFCLYSYHVDAAAGNGVNGDAFSIRGRWINNSTYRFSRGSSESNLYISYFFITIPGTELQRVDDSYSTSVGLTERNITIDDVGEDMSKVFVPVPSLLGNTETAGGDVRDALVRHTVTTPTNLLLSIYSNTATTMSTSSQVLKVSGGSSSPLPEPEITQTLLTNDNGNGTFADLQYSDPSLVVTPGNDLRLYYRERVEGQMYYIESSDGENWGSPVQVNYPAGWSGSTRIGVMYHNGWKGWCDDGGDMHIFESTNGVDWDDLGVAFSWKTDTFYTFFYDTEKELYVSYGRVRGTGTGGWGAGENPEIDRRGISFHSNATWAASWSNAGQTIVDPMDLWDYNDPITPDIYQPNVFWNADLEKYQAYSVIFFRNENRVITDYGGPGNTRLTGPVHPIVLESTDGINFSIETETSPITLTPHLRFSNFQPPWFGESNTEPTCPTCYEVGQLYSSPSGIVVFGGEKYIAYQYRDDTHYEYPSSGSPDYQKIVWGIYIQKLD